MDKKRERFICLLIILLCCGYFPFSSQANALILQPELKSNTQNNINQNIFGNWNIQTIVTKSNCPYILVGTTTESSLEIKSDTKEKDKPAVLKALWKGGRWKKSKTTIKMLNDKEAISERITELRTKDNIRWKAILIDHLEFEENDIMHSESIVIQYKNDTLVGDYKTYSYLTKSED